MSAKQVRFLALVAVLVAAALLLGRARAGEPPVKLPEGLGVGIAWQRGDAWAARSLELLQPPVWLNWVFDHLEDPRYLPMAYSLAAGPQNVYLEAATRGHPRLWLLGNEPDFGSTYTDPVVAAASVQRWRAEYSGPIACCGTVLWDGDWWRQWLDAYLAAGGPVPDVWHFHVYTGYPAPDTPLVDHLTAFRAWMVSRDVARQLLISETSWPYGFAAQNRAWMADLALAVADDPDLLAAIWYSDNDWHDLWLMTDLLSEDQSWVFTNGELFLALQPGGASDPDATPTFTPTLTPTVTPTPTSPPTPEWRLCLAWLWRQDAAAP